MRLSGAHLFDSSVRQRTEALRGDHYACACPVFPSDRKAIMPLITLIVTLAVVGLILWAINTYLPMDGKIKKILNVVVVIIVILWLLQVFGLLPSLSAMRIG
jgi:hypothetical protein